MIAYRNNAAVRLSDVADVLDSVENLRHAGISQGKPAVLAVVFRQPGANIIDTVDELKAAIPQLLASMPRDIDLLTTMDRTPTIRASLHETEITLLIAVGLVTGVVFLFLRSARATLIPAIAVPVSIIGTFGAMYLLGYSLDNLSLMALTVATGFVVDDAIVVLENISRHVEDGMPRLKAALLGCQRGRLHRRFDQYLADRSVPADPADGWHHRPPVPRICRHAVDVDHRVAGHLADHHANDVRTDAAARRPPNAGKANPVRPDDYALRSNAGVVAKALVTREPGAAGHHWSQHRVVCCRAERDFSRSQDTGRMAGGLQADQSISFQAMEQKLTQISDIVQHDPAVETVVGFTGANGGARATNAGSVYVSLKPRAMRDGIETVITRLRDALSVVPGAKLYLVPVQDINTTGGRQTNAAYQYTLQSDSAADLYRMGAQAGHRARTRSGAARR